ncbi:MAG: hypothetical protein HFH68_00280 [Lachnospiraceae bacterium]|nr:hypothetical protein [Lachnospiraceae bacterium]
MVKSELINKIWENTSKSIEKVKIEYIINNSIKIIGNEIKEGHNVKIEGLGSFRTCYRKPYTGNDIKNGQTVKIPKTVYIRFTPSHKIKPE